MEIDRNQKKPLHGDVAGHDMITVGNISSSSSIAIGRGASASVVGGLPYGGVEALFAAIYRQIESRPADPKVDTTEIHESVRMIQMEVSKGADASPGRVKRWLTMLTDIAPDIAEATLVCLSNPEVALSVQEIARKARNNDDIGPAMFDTLLAQVESSNLHPDTKTLVQATLGQLRVEVDKGDAGDIERAYRLIEGIASAAPEIRSGLKYWLETNREVTTPLRIVARRSLS